MHLTSESYSMLKYGINTEMARNKYEKMTDGQRNKFDWFSLKFPTLQETVFASIGCELASIDVRFAPREEVLKAGKALIGRRAAMSYYLKSDRDKHEASGVTSFDELVIEYCSGKYSPEYVLLLDHAHNRLDLLYNSNNYVWAKKEILALRKYRGFFNPAKFSSIISHHDSKEVTA